MRPGDERVFIEYAAGNLNHRWAGSESIASLKSILVQVERRQGRSQESNNNNLNRSLP